MRSLGWLAVLALAACDPIWGAKVVVRDPASRMVDDATLAVACAPDTAYGRYQSMAVRSRHDGTATVAQIGSQFPEGCDIFVAKPGFKTHHIPYRALCPNGPAGCQRYFEFDLVLEPE